MGGGCILLPVDPGTSQTNRSQYLIEVPSIELLSIDFLKKVHITCYDSRYLGFLVSHFSFYFTCLHVVAHNVECVIADHHVINFYHFLNSVLQLWIYCHHFRKYPHRTTRRMICLHDH